MSKVLEIHGSELYGIIVETGCSTSTSSKLMDVAGASKTIFYSLQPYSKVYEEQRYGHFSRSVSKEFIESVLNTESYQKGNDINFVLASSWQLNNDADPLQIPHGWFGLYDIRNNKKHYLHFTINRYATESYCDLIVGKHNVKKTYQETRNRLIDTIGHIGVNILHTAIKGEINDFDLNLIPNNNYLTLDSAYEGNSINTSLLISVLEKFKNDYFIVFKDNQAIRLEDIMREGNEFLIQKGSFNPIHHGHTEMMQLSKKAHVNAVPIFLISTFRYDKPHISIEEIELRIQQINKLGYPLIICKTLFYYDTFKLLNYWSHNKRYYFPIGMDTLIRIHQTDLDTVEKNNTNIKNQLTRMTIRGYVERNRSFYLNSKFLVFSRKGYQKPDELNLYNSMCEYIDRDDDGISSTAIREGRMENKLNV